MRNKSDEFEDDDNFDLMAFFTNTLLKNYHTKDEKQNFETDNLNKKSNDRSTTN